MLKTNLSFLENDLLDVVRMFRERNYTIEHTGAYENGVFYNTFRWGEEKKTFQDFFTPSGELEYKRYAKRFAKLHLYEILSSLLGEKMPWGALTGIRPTKYAYAEIEKGKSGVEALKKMLVSEENVSLVMEILENQKGIYERKDGNSDLFVSIPFCPSKCEYCSFITAPIEKTRSFLEDYLSCLEKELAATPSLIQNLRSIYVGGGTPLVLNEKELERVLKAIAPLLKDGCEYTVEAGRPDVFTEEKLQLLKEYSVTRICINAQSFLNSTLQKIGRKHTAEQVFAAFEMAEKYHFDVNCDLIAGLADEKKEDFVYSVEQAIACKPENITVHTLCLKSGAKLKEECSFLNTEGISEMILSSRELLKAAGYEPYYLYRQKYMAGNCENSGWCKPNKACVYNIDIMEEIADNPAVGANAVSKRVFTGENRIERYGSPKDLKTYIEKIDEVIETKERLFSSSARE